MNQYRCETCDFPTPKEGVEVFEQHRKECETGWRELQQDGE